jgi:hypothetical protein
MALATDLSYQIRLREGNRIENGGCQLDYPTVWLEESKVGWI